MGAQRSSSLGLSFDWNMRVAEIAENSSGDPGNLQYSTTLCSSLLLGLFSESPEGRKACNVHDASKSWKSCAHVLSLCICSALEAPQRVFLCLLHGIFEQFPCICNGQFP